jgi:hypothetical protein
MTDIGAAAPAAEVAPSAPAQSTPTPDTSASTPNTGTDTQTSAPAATAPPGWSQRDGKWVWKGVVDGEETELDHERAEHFLRTKESGQRRWQEAARAKQEAEARERQLEDYLESIRSPQGLRELARQLKMDPREVAEAILAEEMQEAALTPQERELRELRARDAERTRAEQQRAAQEREAQIQAHKQQFTQRLVGASTEALERVGAPQNQGARQWMTRRIAELYVDHRQNGEGTITVDDLAKRAVSEYRDLASGAFTADDLIERVWSNEQAREKLRARYLEAAKPAHPSKPQPVPRPGDLPPRAEDGKFTKLRIDTSAAPSDFSRQLDELMKRKGA